jgi:hypothetical protein
MRPPLPTAAAQRLLTLPDAHGALLAEFDFFPEHEILWVHWHGHLTPAAVVAATEAAIELRPNGTAPRRLLSDESQASGDWSEAMPWMQYEWLPNAARQGLKAMAFVMSPDPASTSGDSGFIADGQRLMAIGVFRNTLSAWQWLLRQPPQS